MNMTVIPEFAAFSRGLEWYNPIPNIFVYFLEDDSEAPFKRADEFGYDSVYWITNAGKWLFIFAVLCFMYLVFHLMSKFKSERVSSFGRKAKE